jgi:hypothetical protein
MNTVKQKRVLLSHIAKIWIDGTGSNNYLRLVDNDKTTHEATKKFFYIDKTSEEY